MRAAQSRSVVCGTRSVRSLVILGMSADVEEQAEGMDALAAVVAEQGIEPVIDGVLYFMLGDTSLNDPSRADVLASARATRSP
jgi:3-oxoadipate enol-lactonase